MKTQIILVLGLLLINILPVAAQTRVGSRPVDSASLRAGFLSAFGNHFELVRDEITSRTNQQGGGSFWLAYAKPLGPGHFSLAYSFKRDDQHYSREEHEIYLTVAPKGCRRGPPSSGVYRRFCVGDTIIVPVFVSAGDGHQFRLTRQTPAADESFEEKYPDHRDNKLDKTPVENPSENLRYIGRSSYKAFHRSLGYTLYLSAEFEAVKPGKFNLLVNSSAFEPGESKTQVGIPIIVVDRETPLALIAGREEVRGYVIGHNGEERLFSTSGNSYMTSLIVLQPGDRVSFTYLSVRRGAQFERRGYAREGGVDPAENTLPVISVHPFRLDPAHDYSGWLVDHLP